MATHYSSTQGLLFLLGLYNYLDGAFSEVSKFATKLYRGVKETFSPKIYYLFECLPAAYLTTSVNIAASSSAVPDWYYLAETKTFVEWEHFTPISSLMRINSLQLPVLSMEIVEEGAVVYDLTEFIENIKIHTLGDEFFPSIAHILAAWSISSGIVLDNTREFTIRMIDTQANTIEAAPNSYAYIHFRDHEDIEAEDLEAEDLSGQDLSGQDLSGQDLSGQHLSGQDLSGQDLSGQDLSGQDLSGQDLSCQDLSGTNLEAT